MNKNAGKKILIVDDDDILLDFFTRALGSEGFSVTAVANGDDAIEELEKNPDYALAIVDLLMPVKTGWDVIDFMKSRDEYKNIPILVLTGLAASFNEFQKAADACDAVLHKGSFEISELLSTVNDLISGSHKG